MRREDQGYLRTDTCSCLIQSIKKIIDEIVVSFNLKRRPLDFNLFDYSGTTKIEAEAAARDIFVGGDGKK